MTTTCKLSFRPALGGTSARRDVACRGIPLFEVCGNVCIIPRITHTIVAEADMREEKSAREIAWELFEKTGNVSYYMLYQQLKER